jgi:hypothetical protein
MGVEFMGKSLSTVFISTALILLFGAGSFDAANAQTDACLVKRCESLGAKVSQCHLKRHSKVYNKRCAKTLKNYKRTCTAAESVACFELYAPVCGYPPVCCPKGKMCVESLPPPVTYSNSCFLEGAGATFLHEGEC